MVLVLPNSSGTTCVIYEFCFCTAFVDTNSIGHYKFFIDSDESVHHRKSLGGNASQQFITARSIIPIGGSANTNTGRQSSWTGAKTLKMQVREYGSGNEQKIYNSTYWDGSGGNEFQVPSLTITSLDNQMTDEEKLEQLRTSRDLLLMNTDAWALVDRNMSQEQKDYRQALRDITKTYKSLDDVKWASKPDK